MIPVLVHFTIGIRPSNSHTGVPQGVSNIRSDVLLAVWKAFRDNNIQIPFPQRDLHIVSGNLPSTTDL